MEAFAVGRFILVLIAIHMDDTSLASPRLCQPLATHFSPCIILQSSFLYRLVDIPRIPAYHPNNPSIVSHPCLGLRHRTSTLSSRISMHALIHGPRSCCSTSSLYTFILATYSKHNRHREQINYLLYLLGTADGEKRMNSVKPKKTCMISLL